MGLHCLHIALKMDTIPILEMDLLYTYVDFTSFARSGLVKLNIANYEMAWPLSCKKDNILISRDQF